MAELKTKVNEASVTGFLDRIPDAQRRQDCYTILELMRNSTGSEPKMWGDSVVGLGDYHYKYESGREADWFLMGFSPRKQNLTLYFTRGFGDFGDLLGKLGKHKRGKGCLYISRIAEVDLEVLRKIIDKSARSLPPGG